MVQLARTEELVQTKMADKYVGNHKQCNIFTSTGEKEYNSVQENYRNVNFINVARFTGGLIQ